MGKILPILLALIGLGGGVGAGILLRPAPEEVVLSPCGDGTAPAPVQAAPDEGEEAEPTTAFVKINNQFVVPVVAGDRVTALVVMSISLEVKAGQTEGIYAREPKVRDVFLQVLFDHANAGGFDGAFTSGPKMTTLRGGLTEAARIVLGDNIVDVLITDIARQDV
ncbi:flagellar basal body-associated FliL family protein [uncultured Maritimibacter sp.]|jgi:hypothetical protein|uniref:flagellar basal body-associated FliL family protein n=1 Tax=uncultured Maritimibacter sp. TaxID=991866 RepID=UPI000AFBACEB|nr:flagellar basal body-associated FliL family protein [uncultured Maritimibacter sp.]